MSATIERAAVVGPLRDWLRDVAAVAALCGTDTTLAEPSIYAGGRASAAAYPVVVLSKVGTVDDHEVESPLIQFDCIGDPQAGGASVAETLAAAVKTALVNLDPHTQLGTSEVYAMGAVVESDIGPITDPDDNRPRYVVTASVTTKVVPA